jgi:hypothetical protein
VSSFEVGREAEGAPGGRGPFRDERAAGERVVEAADRDPLGVGLVPERLVVVDVLVVERLRLERQPLRDLVAAVEVDGEVAVGRDARELREGGALEEDLDGVRRGWGPLVAVEIAEVEEERRLLRGLPAELRPGVELLRVGVLAAAAVLDTAGVFFVGFFCWIVPVFGEKPPGTGVPPLVCPERFSQ